jgi:hypothetical protein
MKKEYTLFMLLIISVTQLSAQSSFSGDVELSSGFESNVFNSPESYLDRAGTLYDKNDLVVSDGFVQYGWKLKYKTILKQKHSIRIQNTGGFKNFFSIANANQGGSDLSGKYIYKKSDKLNFGYNIDIARSKKLVTNILGDEVTAPFTFTQFINEGYVQYVAAENNKTRIGGYYKVRRYKSDPNTESLSYNTPSIFFSTEQSFKINSTKTKLKLGVESKTRKYIERTAKDANGNGQLGYPTRNWSYFITDLAYNIEFSNGIEFEPFVKYTKRNDKFEDQFSYKEFKSGLKFSYSADNYILKFKGSYYNKNYDIRPALQTDGTEIPLKYKYLNLSVSGEYNLSKKITLFMDVDYVSRDSNVTNIGRRPRREFKTYEIYGGIQYSFKKSLKI